MEDIKKYISDLNWNNPYDIQQKAIEQLSKINENEVILLAKQSKLCNKSCWHNAAIVLKNIGYPKNKLAIPYLMEWYQDINWPGVEIVTILFKEIDIKILLPYIKNTIKEILKTND